MKIRPLLLCVFSLLFFGSVSQAVADYYRYTDSRGVISITNKLDSVPLKYRSKMKVIREPAAAQKETGAGGAETDGTVRPGAPPSAKTEEPQAPPAPAPVRIFKDLCTRFAWFRPLAYIFAFLASWIAIAKVCDLLPSRLLGRTLHVAFFFGVFFLIFKSYSDHAVDTYQKLKQDADSIVKKSKERQGTLPEAPQGTVPERAQ